MDWGELFARWPSLAFIFKWGGWLLLTLMLVFMIRMSFARSRKEKPPHPIVIVSAEEGFKVLTEGFEKATVRWSDIEAVTMIRTNQGPWKDDLFYHIVYPGGDLTLPSKAEGIVHWVGTLTALPGFDLESYGQALRSTQNDSFAVVLKRS
ncbi:hypothetical protein [Asticcacaulis sp. W401b]|uniref:hypothetical protein n=1 Tax=Asticcacaulis sp. W401b TaxID=3388666 RepID=UPI003970D1FD